MLFLIAEAPFHEGGAKVSDDASRRPRLILLGLRSLAYERCCDFLLRTVLAVVIVCIDGIRADLSDFHACQLLLVLDSLFQAYALVERLEGMVLDEGNPVYL